MSLIPAFEIGVWNAWIFMIIYPLQWLAVIIVPKHIAERTSHAPEILQTRQDRVMAFLNQGFWIGATLYSIFLPLHTGTAWLYTGLGFFITGLIILILATLAVSRTKANEPFTGSVYCFSRHPMYLSMILVYLGVSIAAASWLFLLITIITFFLHRFQMLREERYCLKKYGNAYSMYMDKTPDG